MQAIICPSLLAADFSCLGKECNRMLELGGDYLHMGNILFHSLM